MTSPGSSARATGVVAAWAVGRVGLGLAGALALSHGVVALTHHGRGAAAIWFVAAVSLRLGAGLGDQSLLETLTARGRREGRRTLLARVHAPAFAGGGARTTLSDDIDTAAEAPALTLWRLSIGAAGALLVVIGVAGGWWSLGIVLALTAAAIPLYQRTGSRSAGLEIRYRDRRQSLAQAQLAVLRGGLELRGLGAIAGGAARVADLSDRAHDAARRVVRTALGSSLVTEFLGGVSVGLVAMVTGFALLHGTTSLFRALLSVLATAEFVGHVRRYGLEFHRRDAITNALARLDEPVVARRPGVGFAAHDLVTEARSTPVSLHVRPGERLVVRGPSGVGKTTLVATLLGWRTPRTGLATAPPRVGYVAPSSALLSTTVRSNLTLGVDLPGADVRAVLDDLGLTGDRFADLDAPLRAEGVSTGERVRLVLARAWLSGPDGLVLDDIAGVLDPLARERVIRLLAQRRDLSVIECSIDRPLLRDAPTLVLS